MTVNKIPLSFDCEGSLLIGVLTLKNAAKNTIGIITVPAGGPQYRAGVGRQLVTMASDFAERGIPVLRFDYRGMGDSEGEFRDFQSILPDLKAAVAEFRRQVPGLEKIVLWGGCNAASASMMFASRIEEVAGMVLMNPFVMSRDIQQKAVKQHYLDRIRQKEFWRKLLTGQYQISAYVAEFINLLKSRLGVGSKAATKGSGQKPFQQRMLEGMESFGGQSLIVTGGRSVESRHFQLLIDNDKRWYRAIHSGACQLVSVGHADQAFSSSKSRTSLFDLATQWMEKTF